VGQWLAQTKAKKRNSSEGWWVGGSVGWWVGWWDAQKELVLGLCRVIFLPQPIVFLVMEWKRVTRMISKTNGQYPI
jgi:hypothetical protein